MQTLADMDLSEQICMALGSYLDEYENIHVIIYTSCYYRDNGSKCIECIWCKCYLILWFYYQNKCILSYKMRSQYPELLRDWTFQSVVKCVRHGTRYWVNKCYCGANIIATELKLIFLAKWQIPDLSSNCHDNCLAIEVR